MKKVKVTRISTGSVIVLRLSADDLSKLLLRCEGLLLEVLG